MLKSSTRVRLAFAGLLPLATAAMLAAAPAPAFAAPTTVMDVVSETVKYGDLDLTRSFGVSVLKRRVSSAIDRVCAPTWRMTPAERQAYRACIDTARADTGAQVERAIAEAHVQRALARN